LLLQHLIGGRIHETQVLGLGLVAYIFRVLVLVLEARVLGLGLGLASWVPGLGLGLVPLVLVNMTDGFDPIRMLSFYPAVKQ
jgi:hypothetical protein